MPQSLLRRVIVECLLWLVVSIVFGLLQLWLSIGYNYFRGLDINYDTYFVSGVLLFFCSGVTMSSSFDIWIEEKISKNDGFYVLFHILIPIILLIVIAILYLSTIDGKVVIFRVKSFQIGILIYSIIYSTCSKIQLGLV